LRKPLPRTAATQLACTCLFLLTASEATAGEAQASPAVPPAAAATSHAADTAAIDPNNLTLFAVELDGLTLTDGLAGYGDAADPLLPVGEIARLLEADVDVLPGDRRIVGRLGEARRPLLVDLTTHTARVDAAEIALSDDDVAVTPTEIYIRASALQRLLPLKLKVDVEGLSIKLTASERFPVQSRLERLSRRPDASSINRAAEEVLDIGNPHRLFVPPSFDVVLDGGYGTDERGLSTRYDLRFAGDLGYMNYQGYVASDQAGRASSARLTFLRRSYEGRLLGRLRARELALGDVFTPTMPVGLRSGGGRGITMSTVPLDQANIFNNVDLRGELPPGYDVELYVNDVLRGSTNQAPQGRYEFLDVPLSPGVNVIRVVTYSPRGERTETTRVVNIAGGVLRRGEANLSIGVIEQDQPLFRIRDPEEIIGDEVGEEIATGLRAVATVNYGLLDFLTVSASTGLGPRPDGGQTGYYALGARTSLFGIATQADLAGDDRGGSAAAIGLAGEFRGVAGILRHAEYRGGFLDENNLGASLTQQLVRRTEVTADANLDLRGRLIPASLRVIRNAYSDGSADLGFAARGSSSIGNLLFSTGLDYRRRTSRVASPIQTLSGYLTASTFRSYAWQLRATLDYVILPEWKPRSLSITADRRINDDWSIRLGLGQPLDDPSGFTMVASTIYTTRFGDLALTGEYSNASRDWRIGAQFSFGLGYNPLGPGYVMNRPGPGAGGSLIVDAYYDENGDGVRQPAEQGAQNVILQGGVQRSMATDKHGRAFMTGLGASAKGAVTVSLDQLENPSVSSPPATVQVTPRPGRVSVVNYPLRPTGDVTVKIELVRDNGAKVGLSSVRVQLQPEKGSPVEVTTEFDGSAIFSGVPVGTYRLALNPDQARQLRMTLLQDRTVVIKGDGSFTPDVAAEVRFDAAPDAAANAPA
jgi:hypothetical protein